ncbi:hypothetical protein [uncultured Bradyrhizobium sp.]|uniref:hypothetical protein n=1 Tax=uncultured Bradyrhizobium sp. TaxID=199684 RepID=UPI0026301A0F|nr:hypothetical protein [uncultured Bradyrhizobium sp.]
MIDLSLLQKHVSKFIDFLRFDIYEQYDKIGAGRGTDDRAVAREGATVQVSCRRQLGILGQSIASWLCPSPL